MPNNTKRRISWPVILLLVAACFGCNRSNILEDHYTFILGVSSDKLAPDSLKVNGEIPEIEFERHVESRRLNYKIALYEPIVSNGPSVAIEWSEGKNIFRADLLLGQRDDSAIFVNTEKWKSAHLDLPESERITYLVLVGEIELVAFSRNGVTVPESEAARFLTFPETD